MLYLSRAAAIKHAVKTLRQFRSHFAYEPLVIVKRTHGFYVATLAFALLLDTNKIDSFVDLPISK